MIIIKAQGGLGNQLFQFALYKKIEKIGLEVCFDKSIYESKHEKREWMLDDMIANLRYSDLKEVYKIADDYLSLGGLIVRKLLGSKSTHFYERDSYEFYPEVLSGDTLYLDGYWQNEQYFGDIRESIIKDIQFPVVKGRYIDYKKQIAKSNSVSVHVRRGDYLNNSDIYTNLCETDYYERAISYMCEKQKNLVFFIFSDDIDWCKKNIQFGDCKIFYIDNKGFLPYDDLYLMSLCCHNIIANSTFSWWGNYLGTESKKIVVGPHNWFVDEVKNKKIRDALLSKVITL